MRALLGVYDKTGITAFARALVDMEWELVSTGGTYKTVNDSGTPLLKVEQITGFPEMMDGRVKTLHPGVHAGILARRDVPEHLAALEREAIGAIDMVVCNLYPFRETVTRPGATYEEGIENIDIGGPAMLRAASKNHQDVVVVVDPADYDEIIERLKAGTLDLAFRRHLAWKAFSHVASYDSTVAEWLWSGSRGAAGGSRGTARDSRGAAGDSRGTAGDSRGAGGGEGRPPVLTVPMELVQELRYGENPHQSAGFYRDRSLREHGMGGIATAVQHHGMEMSFVNYLDADGAWEAVNDFPEPTCVVVKHANPCGVASRDDLLEAYRLAVQADPVSAYGGIIAFNRPITEELAREIREYRNPTDGTTRMLYHIVVAPAYTPEGLTVLKGKSKDLRILEAHPRKRGGTALRQVGGGWLVQDADDLGPDDIAFEVVTEAQPGPALLDDMKFAWRCVKHVTSNAITVARDKRLLGMGSGQPNRVKSVEIAMEKAGAEVKGAVLASDAFFPFAWGDAIEQACQAGIGAIVHPGGSMRDQDGIDCCNQYGVPMVLTHTRHFRH